MKKFHIQINDFIGSWTQRYVKDQLDSMTGKHVDMLISSYGGSVQAALGIFRAIKDHGDVTVWFNGFVASAATFLAMGAKEIKMSKYSLLLIHKCLSTNFIWDDLNEEQLGALIMELQKKQENQQKIDNIISYIYADRCGKDKNEILQMMSEAKWLDKDECKACGLVDSFFDGEPVAITSEMKNYFKYNNMPELPDFANAWAEEGKEESLLRRFINKLNGSSGKAEEPQEETIINNVPEEEHNPIFTMNKSWTNTNAILNVDGVEVDDKKNAAVTEAQMQTLEDRITALQTEVANLKASEQTLKNEKATLENKVKNLEKLPADESTTKVEDLEAPVVDQAAYINALSQYV